MQKTSGYIGELGMVIARKSAETANLTAKHHVRMADTQTSEAKRGADAAVESITGVGMRPIVFKLRFAESQVPRLAERYFNPANDGTLRDRLRPLVRARGYLERDEFLEICEWKSPRTKPWCARNDDFTIRTVTQAAFISADEPLKIDLLRTLVGVEWPTASTLLNFCDRRPYPILDYRALWSLGTARARIIRWSSGSSI